MNDQIVDSLELIYLHVFIVPLELWIDQYNFAYNNAVLESKSAGFIRIAPKTCLHEVRQYIADQLGQDTIPKDFVYLRSVGRCLAVVNQNQEVEMRAREFVPPATFSPELLLLPTTHEDVHKLKSAKKLPQRNVFNNYNPIGGGLDSTDSRENSSSGSDDVPFSKLDNHGQPSFKTINNNVWRLGQNNQQQHHMTAMSGVPDAANPDDLFGEGSAVYKGALNKRSAESSTSSAGNRKTENNLRIGAGYSPLVRQRSRTSMGFDEQKKGGNAATDYNEPRRRSLTLNDEQAATSTLRILPGNALGMPSAPGIAFVPATPNPVTPSLHHGHGSYSDQEGNSSMNGDSGHEANSSMNGESGHEANSSMDGDSGQGEDDQDIGSQNETVDQESETDDQESERGQFIQDDEERMTEEESNNKHLILKSNDEIQIDAEEAPALSSNPTVINSSVESGVSPKNDTKTRRLALEAKMKARFEKEKKRLEEDEMVTGELSEKKKLELMSQVEEIRKMNQSRISYAQSQYDAATVASTVADNQQNEALLAASPRVAAGKENKVKNSGDSNNNKKTTNNDNSRRSDEKKLRELKHEEIERKKFENEEKKRLEAEQLKAKLEEIKAEKHSLQRSRELNGKKVRNLQIEMNMKTAQINNQWKKKYEEERRQTVIFEDKLKKLHNEVDSQHRKLISRSSVPGKPKDVHSKGAPSERSNQRNIVLRLQNEIEQLKMTINLTNKKLVAETKMKQFAVQDLKELRNKAIESKINAALAKKTLSPPAVGGHHLTK